ncbi:MAG TPA: hypothetical protein PLQ13_07185 [Candidatus Krumholzibacteria bacterium]|nr:hypothetical protein [Candidatus Krumholzibacteria bacterium]
MLAIGAVLLLATALLRPIDGDEGYYAAAAGLTAGGAAPYADYFYPQAPLLPYLYAPLVKVAGPDLRALRLQSAVLAVLTLVLWGALLAHVWRGRPWLQVAGLALLVAAPGVVSWAVTVKTYALTGLLSLAALAALARGVEHDARPGWLAAAGLAAGLAGSVRLFFAPVGPVLALALVLWPAAGGRRRALAGAAWLLAGTALGLAPLAAAWLQAPGVAVFNNVGYHELRFSELRDLHPDAGLGRRAIASLIGTSRVLATRPYLLGSLLLAAWGAAGLGRSTGAEGRFLRASGLAAAVLLLAAMAPDPVHAQYFTSPLVIALLPLATAGLARLGASSRRQGLAAAAAALVVGGGLLGVLRPGMVRDPLWSLANYDQVVADIQARTRPGDTVFSFWPGYVFGADRRYLPGMENQFAIGVSEALDAEQRRRFHVAGRHELARAFAAREPALVVLGAWMNEVNTALDDHQMTELLAVFHAQYDAVAADGDVTLCAPRRHP